MSIQGTTDSWQAVFQPASIFAGNARSFWTVQTDVLNSMQSFAESWFEHRRAGTKAALEAFESMCAAKSSTEWFDAYQKWLIGASERLMADGVACGSEIRKLSEVLAPPLVPATEHEQRDGVQDVPKKRARAQPLEPTR